MPSVDFVTVDVFTTSRFVGNPLAVITDARGLSTSDMQSIAAEFGYSETTFVLPPSNPANTAHVRIFTPTAEVPFAGHPNVGTAFVIGQQPTLFDKPVENTVRFEEEAGIVDVTLVRDSTNNVTGATIRAPGPLTIGASVAPNLVARCACIDPSRVKVSPYPPIIASVGLAFAFAELDGLEALAATRGNVSEFHAADTIHGDEAQGFPLFLYVRNADDPWHIRARMFAPMDNVAEDPATGSASAALGAFLVSRLPKDDARVRATIEQGVEMGRRSVIELEIVKAGGEITDVFVTGQCVAVMRGSVSA